MGARYPYYLLADSKPGRQKDAELSHSIPSNEPVNDDIRHGFVYERIPHVTLKAIANNAEIETIWEASIVAFPAYNATKIEMLERARSAGRLPSGGATDVAPDSAGGQSHDADVVDADIRAAYWRARLNLSKQKAS